MDKRLEILSELKPDIDFETGEIFGFGGDEDGEEFEFEEGDETDW